MMQITGIGRLGRDPELRFTASGKAVCSPSVAFDEGFGDRKKTHWAKVECWEKTAEAVSQYCTKGSQVYVQGRLELEEWQDRDGKPRVTLKVVAGRVEFLSGGGNGNGSGYRQERQEPTPEASESSPSNSQADDDVPF